MLIVDLASLVTLGLLCRPTRLTRQRQLFLNPLAINNTFAWYFPEKNIATLWELS